MKLPTKQQNEIIYKIEYLTGLRLAGNAPNKKVIILDMPERLPCRYEQIIRQVCHAYKLVNRVEYNGTQALALYVES